MSLIARLEGELKQAMVERDHSSRDALRLILSSLRSAETERWGRLWGRSRAGTGNSDCAVADANACSLG